MFCIYDKHYIYSPNNSSTTEVSLNELNAHVKRQAQCNNNIHISYHHMNTISTHTLRQHHIHM